LFNGKDLFLNLYPSNRTEYLLFGKTVAIYDQIFAVYAEEYNNLQGAVYVYEVNSSIPTLTPSNNSSISTPTIPTGSSLSFATHIHIITPILIVLFILLVTIQILE
jgi:hypothetical protein